MRDKTTGRKATGSQGLYSRLSSAGADEVQNIRPWLLVGKRQSSLSGEGLEHGKYSHTNEVVS